MNITIPVWSIFLLVSLISLAYAYSRPTGGDYFLPLGRLALTLAVIVFWVAWGFSKLF